MGLLTDTHCHLNLNIFQEDLAQTLERAWERGLARILVPSIDVETSRRAVELADRYPNLFAAVGVHPGDASAWKPDTISILRELAGHPKVVAIGEIGLDYYRDRSPRPLQLDVFRAQLALAAETGLPVVVHNRDSIEDVWRELSSWQADLARKGVARRSGGRLVDHPGVLHSYDGTLSAAAQAAERNFFIGISGPVTFKNAPERQQVAAGLPLDRLLVETDAPFLTPHPHRGRRNEPAYVALVVEKLAELHRLPFDAVQRATWDNAAQLFDWGANP